MIHLMITSVDAGSGAERAGLKVGDWLIKVNEVEVTSNAALTRELARLASGRTAQINREGHDIDVPLPDGRLGMLTEEGAFDLVAARRAHTEAHRHQILQSVTVATLDAIDGKRIDRVCGLVTAEYAVGMNVLKDVMVGGRDLFGGRSQTIQNAFKEARGVCTDELRQQAFDLGANAVLGIRFQHSQMSGTGTTMLLVVMSGTAVELS